jgi:hypothetical protein
MEESEPELTVYHCEPEAPSSDSELSEVAADEEEEEEDEEAPITRPTPVDNSRFYYGS